MLFLLGGQKKNKCPSFPFFAFNPNTAIVHLDHCLGYCKSQPHASITTGKMGFDLEKSFKDTRQIPGCDSQAIIDHTYFEITSIFLNLHHHMPPGFCEL